MCANKNTGQDFILFVGQEIDDQLIVWPVAILRHLLAKSCRLPNKWTLLIVHSITTSISYTDVKNVWNKICRVYWIQYGLSKFQSTLITKSSVNGLETSIGYDPFRMNPWKTECNRIYFSAFLLNKNKNENLLKLCCASVSAECRKYAEWILFYY